MFCRTVDKQRRAGIVGQDHTRAQMIQRAERPFLFDREGADPAMHPRGAFAPLRRKQQRVAAILVQQNTQRMQPTPGNGTVVEKLGLALQGRAENPIG